VARGLVELHGGRIALRSAGFDGHLAKPVTLARLKAVLASADRSSG
jgi:hypothetical protein